MLIDLFIVLGFLFLSLIYIHPAEVFLFLGDASFFPSQGTDPTSFSYLAGLLRSEFELNPKSIFYGSLPTKLFNAPYGMGVWFSWSEKFLILALSYLVSLEQILSVYLVLMFFLTAVSMYAFARYLAWSRMLSFFAAYLWAFSSYTRARASIHSTLAGLWHLPLLLFGLLMIRRGRSKKDLAIGSLLIFLSATTAHYYLIITLVLSPFILWWVLAQDSEHKRSIFLKRLVLCSMPALLLFAITIFKPIPKDFVLKGVSSYPTTGKSEYEFHPFLYIFAAEPLDYITGDYIIGDWDINPMRAAIAKSWRQKGPILLSVSPERSHGVRWILFFLFFPAIFYAFKKNKDERSQLKKILPILYLGTVAFIISISSPIIFGNLSPAYWIHLLIPQFRVPNRASIFFEFSLIFLVCNFLCSIKLSNKIIAALFFIAFVELPPIINTMPMDETSRLYRTLTRFTSNNECGLGVYLPYVNNSRASLKYYHFLQRMRGSRCQIVNSNSEMLRDNVFYEKFLFSKTVIDQLNNPLSNKRLEFVELAKCIGLDWIVFDDLLSIEAQNDICQRLNFKVTENGVCKSRVLISPSRYKEGCFS